jgi:hypothetical protein
MVTTNDWFDFSAKLCGVFANLATRQANQFVSFLNSVLAAARKEANCFTVKAKQISYAEW